MSIGRPPVQVQLPSEVNKNIAYLLGVLHGDGYLGKNYFEIPVNLRDYDYVKVLVDILRNSGLNPKVYKYNRYEVYTNSRVFKDYLESFGPTKCETWNIPLAIQDNKLNIKAAYLSGLFDTDGTITYNLKNGAKRVALYSKNLKALENVKIMLKSDFSIDSDITKSEKLLKGKLFTWYSLNCSNQISIKLFANNIIPRHPRKLKKLNDIIKSYSGVQEKYYDTKEVIVKLLTGRRRVSTKEMAKILNRDPSTLREHLSPMLQKGLVKRETEFYNRYGRCENGGAKEYFWSLNGA